MEQNMVTRAAELLKKNGRRKRWHRALTAMAAVVVFTTSYMMILPAITLSAEQPQCGMEEHVHTDACYETQLVCGLEENADGHTHGDGCYTEQKTLTCTLTEGEGHTHSDSCYGYVCGLEETAGHTHTDECYTEVPEQILTCTEPEGEGHTHTDSCYTFTSTFHLTCGQEEVPAHTHSDSCIGLICGQQEQAAHTHSDACYTTETVLTCTEPEGHVHSDACYEKVLVCGLPEHTHTDACYPAKEEPQEPELVCTVPEHVHEEACYDAEGNLICTMEEHTHTEECYGETVEIPEEDTPLAAFPEEVPEGYVEYTFNNEEGLTVRAMAPENAFAENVELFAKVLAEDSEEYAQAQENLDKAEEMPEYTGMAAMDIRFVAAGSEDPAEAEEIEPDAAMGPVYVQIDAQALLPDGVDANTLAVQHHVETTDGGLFGTGLFEDKEITVETVADSSTETGEVTAMPSEVNDEIALLPAEPAEEIAPVAMDVEAKFGVESFSTFTITWNTWGIRPDISLNVTCREELPNGSIIEMTQRPDNSSASSDTKRYFKDFTISGYQYSRATANGQPATWIKAVDEGAFLEGAKWRFYSDAWVGGVETPPEIVIYYTKVVSVTINTADERNGNLTAEPSASMDAPVAYQWFNTAGDELGTDRTLSGVSNGKTYYVVATDSKGRSATSQPYTVTGVAGETISKELTYEKYVEQREDGTYDLNLTVSGAVGSRTDPAKIDILMIVDVSGSMNYKLSENEDGSASRGNRRIDEVKKAATSLVDSISSNKSIDARYSLVRFTGPNDWDTKGSKSDANVWQNWTDKASTVKTALKYYDEQKPEGGTNYQAGFQVGKDQAAQVRKDAQLIVIFLTDGKPSVRNGVKSCKDSDTESIRANNNAAVAEIKGWKPSAFYTIGVGPDFTGRNPIGSECLSGLRTQMTTNGVSAVDGYMADDTSGLQEAFKKIIGSTTTFLCNDVTIHDTLSQYVQQVDGTGLTVTVEKAGETGSTVIASGPSVTLPKTERNAETTLTPTIDDAGKLTLGFPAEYILEPDYTYKVTVNIEPSEMAYAEYAASGYPHTGDLKTGITSESQPGFYSNVITGPDRAYVEYTYKDVPDSRDYPKPVVQLQLGNLVIDKTVSGLDANSLTDLSKLLTFEVKDSSGQVVKTVGPGMSNPSGVTVTPKADNGGWQITIPNLRAGTYAVTEKGYENAGSFVWVAEGSITEANAQIHTGETATVQLVNNYQQGTGVLTITKQVIVSGASDNRGEKEFEFQLKIPSAYAGSYAVTYSRQDGLTPVHESEQIVFAVDSEDTANAVTELKLYAGETAVIELPVGVAVNVSERNYDGFAPDWTGDLSTQTPGATTTTMPIQADRADPVSITCTNMTGAKLPSTGGPGVGLYLTLGSTLTFGAGLLLILRRRKEGGKAV